MITAPDQQHYRDRYSGNPYGPLPGGEELGMAAHEAAHAVVAAALGYRVTRVTLERSANGTLSWDGVCHYEPSPSADAMTRTVHDAIVAVAAYAGQRELPGAVRFTLPDQIFGGDAGQLQACADALGVAYSDLRSQCLDTAPVLLARYVEAWRLVTYALVRYRALDGDDLERVDGDLFTTRQHHDAPAARTAPAAPASRSSVTRKPRTTRDIIPGLRYGEGMPVTLREVR